MLGLLEQCRLGARWVIRVKDVDRDRFFEFVLVVWHKVSGNKKPPEGGARQSNWQHYSSMCGPPGENGFSSLAANQVASVLRQPLPLTSRRKRSDTVYSRGGSRNITVVGAI